MNRAIAKLLVAALMSFVAVTSWSADEGGNRTASDIRLIVFLDNANLLESNDGPLKDALSGFLRMLVNETVKNVYAADIYAGSHVPESVVDTLPFILNAANANRLLQIVIMPGPDPMKDPHYVVRMKLAVVDRSPKHRPNAPHYVVSSILWERSFRLGGDVSLSETARAMGAESATQLLAIFRR